MELLIDLSLVLATWIAPYLNHVAAALTASLLFIYGGSMHGAIRKSVASYNFLVRLAFFVFICGFGYGFLSIAFTYMLKQGLMAIPRVWLFPSLAGLFLFVGFLAEEKKQM